MTIYNTDTDLGWSAGADVSSAIGTFFSGTYTTGDTLLFTAVYEISSPVTIPAGAILQATDGNGINVPIGMTGNNPVLEVADGSDGVQIINMTFTADEAPVWATFDVKAEPQLNTDFQNNEFIRVNDAAGFVARDCDFQNQVNAGIDLFNTNAPVIEYCRFYRNKFAIVLGRNVRNGLFRNLFLNEIISEGFKSSSSSGVFVDGANNCTFRDIIGLDINRDLYDMTGGWIDMVHYNDRCNGSTYDIKTTFNDPGDEYLGHGARNLVVNGFHIFTNSGKVLTTTMDQNNGQGNNWLTAQEWTDYGPRNLVFNDGVIEVSTTQNESDHILEKAGTGIVFNDLLVRGFDPLPDERRAYWSENIGGINDDHPPSGWAQTIEPTDGGPYGNTAFNNKTSTMTASGVDPDTDWVWTKKPTAKRRLRQGAGALVVNGARLVI